MEANSALYVKLGDILPRPYKNGIYKNADSYGSGVPILRITDFDNDGCLVTKNLQKIELDENEIKSYELSQNDIVINRVNSLTHLGKAILWTNCTSKTVYESNMMRIEPDEEKVHPQYLIRVLHSYGARIYYRKVAKRAVAQCSINQQDVKGLRFWLPSLPEQKKIAQILSTWDKAITTVEQLLANSQQQKKALMHQLLTGKKRLLDQNGQRFKGEWKRSELGDLLDYSQPTPYLVKNTDYSDKFSTPVLTAGKTFILGYTDELSGIFSENLPAIIFDDFTTDSKFVDFPFKAKSSAMKILTARQGVSIKYVFEAMQLLNFVVGGHQRHWISIYSRLVIPLPCNEEQQKIATVLSAADKEITTLKQQLDHLKQEKKALMQQLLTGKRRVKLDEGETDE